MQFNYSVATREAEKRLLPLCADKGVAVLVNRAFEDGNLFTPGAGQAAAALGGGVRREELGAGVPEVRAGASGGDLRDSGHRQGHATCSTISARASARCPTRKQRAQIIAAID